MNILDRIVADKKKNEVVHRKTLFPSSYWEASPLFDRGLNSLSNRLKESRSGIIQNTKDVPPLKKTSTATYR